MPRICWFNEYHIDECTTEDFINSSSYFSVLSRLCSLAPQAKMALLSVVDERVLRLGLCSAGNRYNIYKTNSKPSNHYHFNTFENFDKEYKNTNFVKNSSNDWLKEDNLQDSYTIALTRERKKKRITWKNCNFESLNQLHQILTSLEICRRETNNTKHWTYTWIYIVINCTYFWNTKENRPFVPN